MTLPELSETDATGRIAEIYADLRSLSGTPVVALIFRHLATHPGLLEDIWASLRPLLRTGRLQETAWRLADQSVPADLIPPIAPVAREALGLNAANLPPILNAIDAYNRANPVNLLVMLTLLRRLELPPGDAAHAIPANWTPPAMIAAPLSRMVPPAEMPPSLRRLVNDIGFGDRTQLDAVVPSLLRHLAESPALLGLLHVLLIPKLRDGSLEAQTDALRREMVAAADALAPSLGPLPKLAALPAVADTMRTFTAYWIPLMTTIGLALRRSLTPVNPAP